MNRLEQIEATVAAATPGPWEKNHWWGGGDCDCGDWYDTEPTSTSHPHDPDKWGGHPDDCAQCGKNEELILHAAQDVPALLAVVRASMARLDRLGECPCCRGFIFGHSEGCPLAALLEEVPE